MPIAVDAAERLDALARATLALAAREGAAGVTIRRVAAALGGSTTMVTYYLPTRASLLLNAVTFMLRRWDAERDDVLAGVADADRLAVLTRWSCATTPEDAAFRRLLLELIARPEPPPGMAPLVVEAREHRDDLADAARRAGLPVDAATADALHLLVRGFYYASVEDPSAWAPERAVDLIDRYAALVSASSDAVV